MTDDEFAAALEALTLPPSGFRHADHVRLAWIYLKRMACRRRCSATPSG